MAVEPILFFDNKVEASAPIAITLTASTTANGYNKDNVRDMNLMTAWKPADGTADEYLQIDPGTTTWLGSAGVPAYFAVAYDFRGADQTKISLQHCATIGGTYTTETDITFTPGGAVGLNYVTFNLPNPARQYWRLTQKNSDRGGGTKTAKVFAWGMYNLNTVFVIGTSPYANETMGRGAIAQVFNASIESAVSGAILSNQFAMPGQEFDLTFQPAALSLWSTLTAQFFDNGGPNRAFFMRFEGLRNTGTANFSLVRMPTDRWEAQRNYIDIYHTSIRLRTEPWV